MPLDHRICGITDDRQHALLAQRSQRGLVGRRPDKRRRVQLPIAGVQNDAGRGVDHQRLRLGDRVRQADEAQREGLQVEASAGRDDVDADLVGQPDLAQLAAQHRGGERGAVDRAFELRPQPGHGADVVLVGMGDHQTDQLVLAVGDEAGIGHHDLDFRQFAAAEADAAIHGEPFFVACDAPAVQVEVHANFARPAQRQEGQFAYFRVHM